MVSLHKLIFYYCLINCFSVLSQWNTQIGYDNGFFLTDLYGNELLSEIINSHRISRLNGKVEYKFKKKVLIALNTGVDIHNIRHHLETKGENIGISSFQKAKSIHHSKIQSNRLGLSIGYEHLFNNTSSLYFLFNYDQFFINKVNIIRSEYIMERFLLSEVEDNNPYHIKREHQSMIDLNDIGYRNKLTSDNRYLYFSLGYRYYKGSFFVSPSMSITTKNKSPVRSFSIPKSQNLFLFGINLGYTLPQKNKTNEK